MFHAGFEFEIAAVHREACQLVGARLDGLEGCFRCFVDGIDVDLGTAVQAAGRLEFRHLVEFTLQGAGDIIRLFLSQ